MGTSRHQEKSVAGKNKRLMRSYYFQGFFPFVWSVWDFVSLGFVLLGWLGFFCLVVFKQKHYNKQNLTDGTVQ